MGSRPWVPGPGSYPGCGRVRCAELHPRVMAGVAQQARPGSRQPHCYCCSGSRGTFCWLLRTSQVALLSLASLFIVNEPRFPSTS